MENLIKRAKAPTPKFFRKLRRIGLITGAIAAGILTAPVSLPAGLIVVAGYIAAAAGTAVTVSQLATKDDEKEEGK